MGGFTVRRGSPDKSRADVVVVGVLRSAKGPVAAPGAEPVAAAYGRRFRPLLSTLGFTGAPGDVAVIPTAGTIESPLLVLVGLGDQPTLTGVRRAAGSAARAIRNAATVALALPAGEPAQVRAVIEGFALGGYSFGAYKTTQPPAPPGDVIVLSETARRDETATAAREAGLVADATRQVRDWVNTPSADLTPDELAAVALGLAKGRRSAITVEVLDEDALRERGFGATLAVGSGSVHPPRVVVLRYEPPEASTRLGLVGAGLTFNAGGLHLLPRSVMKLQKASMAGAGVAIAATRAVADLGLPVALTTVVVVAENMPSGTAMRPGDVVTAFDGTTVEVLDTAASPQLLLADGLGFAATETLDGLVDVVSLSASIDSALGDRVSGLFGNDDGLVRMVDEAAATAGEAVWHMPIPPPLVARVRSSTVADLSQVDAGMLGAPCYAAAFAERFTSGLPWAHLDIGGTSYNNGSAYGHLTKGGTGFGVATLVELARTLSRD
jgi:leucyl aminopeptidase